MVEEKKEEPKEILIVSELPTVQTREVMDETSKKVFECMTITEALKEILETTRKIDKAVA